MNPFWQPARARNQLWRTLLGTLIVAVVYLAAIFAAFFAASRYLGLPDAALAAPATPRATAVFFTTFLGIHLGLTIALALLHRRGYGTLFGPTRRLAAGHVLAGLVAALAIGGALSALMGLEHLVLPQGTSPPLRPNLPFTTWAAWLAPAIVLIFVQILAEEALFRGYLLQQLRARFRAPLIWAILPSALFGALHFDAATFGVINASAYVLNAGLVGAFAAFITLRTGNLGGAVGLHFGNNILLVLIGIEGNLDGFSLFTIALDPKSGYTTYSILTQTAAFALAFAAWWRWMNRRQMIANRAGAT